MIANPVNLRQALYALGAPNVEQDAAASLAALLLGCSLMLQTADELVLSDFRQETYLEWPRIPSMGRERIPDEWLREADVLAGYLNQVMATPPAQSPPMLDMLSKQLFDGKETPSVVIAAIALVLAGMSHSHPLVQVCSAIATAGVARNPLRLGQALNLLTRRYADSDSDLIQQLAFTGISRLFMTSLRKGLRSVSMQMGHAFNQNTNGVNVIARATHALLIHGTVFQRHGSPMDLWWLPPTGDLHQHLRGGSLPHLYTGADHFRWSGGWSDYAREEASEKLIDWLSAKGIQRPDVVAHSHGCNVSMLASQTIDVNRLILLSCPVHWSSYRPGKVQDVLSIRIRWDLVIMADGGAQRFPASSGIREEILPFWFTGHDDPRQSATWQSRNLDGLL